MTGWTPPSSPYLNAWSDLMARGRRFLVTMHRQPDGDAIGSSLALARVLQGLGKEAVVYSADPAPASCLFLPGAERIVASLGKGESFDAIFACDAGERARLGPDVPASGTLVNIDHHASGEPYGELNWIDPAAASTGVVLARLFHGLGVPFAGAVAQALWVSIVSDTGYFHHANTSAEVFGWASLLVSAGVRPEGMAKQMQEHPPVAHFRTLGEVLRTTDSSPSGKVVWLSLERREDDDFDSEGLVGYPRVVAGAEVALLFREEADEVRVSLRSNTSFDVGAFAKSHHGGGHAAAAGFAMPGALETVRARVTEELERMLNG